MQKEESLKKKFNNVLYSLSIMIHFLLQVHTGDIDAISHLSLVLSFSFWPITTLLLRVKGLEGSALGHRWS